MNNGYDKNSSRQSERKTSVIGNPQKKHRMIVVSSMALAALAMCAAAFLFFYKAVPAESIAAEPTPAPAAGWISHPASLFDDGKAHHFTHQFKGVAIRYFVLKSSDGVIRAAFDACDVCWRAGKGYFQDGDQMVCRNCGRRFDSVKINEIQGGCNPAPLTRTLKDGRLNIKTEDIEKGYGYFNL